MGGMRMPAVTEAPTVTESGLTDRIVRLGIEADRCEDAVATAT
ncbi:hypothetical protein ACFWBB_10020 [Streptomyces sp. NPDC060000]